MNDTSITIFQETLEHIDGAYAPSTLRAYRADMAEFIRYCEDESLCALPTAPETVAAFLLSVTGAGPKSATIRRKISSISAIHRLSNLPDPTKHAEVKIALRKMHRRLGRNFAQAYGITLPCPSFRSSLRRPRMIFAVYAIALCCFWPTTHCADAQSS